MDYKADKTQWVKDAVPIQIEYVFEVTKNEDPALISFVENIAKQKIAAQSATLSVDWTISDSDDLAVGAAIDGKLVDAKAAKEINKRIGNSDLLFLYNSTAHEGHFFFGAGRRRMFYQILMSAEEKKAADLANKQMEKTLRRLAKDHTQALSQMLGRLTEKYDVEVSPPEGYASSRMPLGINLKDKNVQVPLDDWGSGTQNRTEILMAILQANRIKTTDAPDEKITPIVVVEEPESFLHPSAQAEFGRMLRHLSVEFGIQIIATTHSPHMLNLEEPSSNILLVRQERRRKLYETAVDNTTGENWMTPFADHLGISRDEFMPLRSIFSGAKSKVLLVEGPTDQEYFEHFQETTTCCECLNSDIEVAPYGGKDTLKNILLIQFVLRKFDQVFLTCDLDAKNEVSTFLTRLGLKDGTNYTALGVVQPGKDCMEGLLPPRVLSAVMGRETDLVMKLASKDNSERRKAKDELKKEYLKEFKKHNDYTPEELRELNKVIRLINARLGGVTIQ